MFDFFFVIFQSDIIVDLKEKKYEMYTQTLAFRDLERSFC